MLLTHLATCFRAVLLLWIGAQLAACSSGAPGAQAESVSVYKKEGIEVALPAAWNATDDEWLVSNHRMVTIEIGETGTALIHQYLPQGEDGVEVPDLEAIKRGLIATWVFHPDGYRAVTGGGKVNYGPYAGEYIAIKPVPEQKHHDRFEFFSLNVGDTHNYVILDIPVPHRKDRRGEILTFLASFRVSGQGLSSNH